MEFHIEHTEVYGLNKMMIASGNSYRTVMNDNTLQPTEKDITRACKLGKELPGTGHDQHLTGAIVQFDIYAPLYMWKEIQRYHFLDFVSSQSTMHCITKFKLKDQCVSETEPEIIDICQKLIDDFNNYKNGENVDPEISEKKWRKIIASLPCGFVLGATMTTNYRQLKTIYLQRKDHKLVEWHDFCKWCESLPMFKELCIKE